MHLTPIRLSALALATALLVGACGQVTGLSDDYTYDLEGGATGDGSSEGATTGDGAASGDGSSDAARDAANKCTTAQTLATTQTLQSYNGTTICNTCLARACCTDVDTCSLNQECDKVLGCKLDCTQGAPGDRAQCLKSCTSSGNPNSLFTTTVGACSGAACRQECGLQ